MLPLKERVPYIVEVEKTTGTAQVLQPVGEERAVPHSELMDKHFISKYIRCREGYDNRTVAGDFEIVKYLSMPDVFEPYLQQFKRKILQTPMKSTVKIRREDRTHKHLGQSGNGFGNCALHQACGFQRDEPPR